MWMIGCFVISLCSSIGGFCAGPMLHLWTAERFCKIAGITDKDTLEGIIVGTEFPDIRYITRESRHLTHPPVLNIQEIYQSVSPFEAGMKLHVWLDVLRENFIDSEIYAVINLYAKGFSATLLKFVEEEMLADFYDGRQWSSCFDKVWTEELAFTDEEMILKWHGIIQWTMSLRPSWYLWAQSYRGSLFDVSSDILYNWSYFLPELKQKTVFQQYLNGLLAHIENELQSAALKFKFVD